MYELTVYDKRTSKDYTFLKKNKFGLYRLLINCELLFDLKGFKFEKI